ncbi:PREDICTED: microtubule-associated protein futsch-like [Nicrophorus vespilloides]|uniref:Microtubule-associated protein futsch-like n=1 Tax=Nicrophorus vespilloides TaxID=110193 RepID=A0ABM1MUR5_NICVS|nr:PREDICTED: microtubule-associated protein futsch-like [Nicrophorus vespilloides]
MNNDFGQLRFLKSDGSGGKPFVLKAESCSIGSSINASIRLMDKGHGLLAVHCIIDVDKNGVATLSNKAPSNPVKLNGQNILKKRCLKPGDVLTIMDKRLRYENENIAPEILSSIDQVRNIKTPKRSRITMVDFRNRRSARTPEPKRPRRPPIKRKRSNSFSNIQEFDIIPEDDTQHSPFKTPGRRKSIRVRMSNSGFTKADVSSSQLVPSKETSTPMAEQKFQVVTPQSTIKPTLRSELLKSLGKPKLPELVKPSEESDTDDIEKRELRTPVAEILENSEDLINFNTPVNNTSIVVIDSPDEENVPVRSKKSLTKDISIQRLTQNDDSIVVLESPNSKTPKSMLRAKPKTPSTNLRKTNLISELEKESFSSTPIAESSAISKQVQFESLRKSMRGSSTSTPDGSPKKMYPKTPRRNENHSESKGVDEVCSSESEEDNFKTPNNNTPVVSKSTMKQRRSTVKMTDGDTTPKAVSPTSVPKSRRSFRNFDSMISDKSSNSSAHSNESLDMQVSTEAISNTDLPDSTSNESLKYLNSAKSIEYLKESVSELSMKDDSFSMNVSPVPNIPKRRAVTEQNVTKRRGQKRRSLNLSSELNQDEVCDDSASSVNTSSFIYIPGDSSKLSSTKVSSRRSSKEKEDSFDLDTNSSMEIGALNVSENSLEEATSDKDENAKLRTPKKSDDSSDPKDEKSPKVQNVSNVSGVQGIFETPKPETMLEDESKNIVKFVETSDAEENINPDMLLVEKSESVICETPIQDHRRSSIRNSKKVEIVIPKSMKDESQLDIFEDVSKSDLVVEENKHDICTTPVPEHQECRRSVRSMKKSVDSPLKKSKDSPKLLEVSTPVPEESNIDDICVTPELEVRRKSVRSLRKSIAATKTPQRKSVIVKDIDEEDDDIDTNEVIDSPTATSPQNRTQNEDPVDAEDIVHLSPVQEIPVCRQSRSSKKSIDIPTTNLTPRRKSRAAEVLETSIANVVEDSNETDELVEEDVDEQSTPAIKLTPQRKRKALEDTTVFKTSELHETEGIVDVDSTSAQEIQVRRQSVRTAKKVVGSPATKLTPQRKPKALEDTTVFKTSELHETEGHVEEGDGDSTSVQEIQVRRQSVRTVKKDVGSPAIKLTPQRKRKALEDTTEPELHETEGIVEGNGNSTPVQEIQVRRQSVRTAKKDFGSPATKSTPQKSKIMKDTAILNTPIQETRRKSARSAIKVIVSSITKSTPQRSSRLMDEPMVDSPKVNTVSEVVQDLIASPVLKKNTPVQDIQVRRLSVRSGRKLIDSPSTKLTPQKRRTLLKDIPEAELINKNVEDVKESALTPNKNGSPSKGNKISTPKSSAEDQELEVHTPENYNVTGNEDEFLTPAFLMTTKERRRTIKSAKRKSLVSLTLSAKKSNSGMLIDSNVSSNENENEISPENDLMIMSPKVVKQLIKTPKHQTLDDLSNPSLGVEQLMDSPKEQKDRENDPRSSKARKELNSPLGVKKLQREPLNDLSNPVGVKHLMTTPKIQKEPENDLTSPRGIKNLMKTPKVQKGPNDDLSNPLGVKQLMKTPKVQNDPLNDLSSPRGVKQLLATPKVQNEPNDDLSNPLGVKQLMKTPKLQNEPLNDLSSPRGVKQLLATPKVQNEPKDDLRNPFGVKQLMKTPKLQNEPLNDLSSPRGVKQLLKTPKAQKDPKNDLSNPLGVKQLMKTPKPQNEPLNDLSSPRGVKQLLRTPKSQNDPKDDLTNPFGVKQLMASPRVPQNEHTNDLTSPHGVKDLFDLQEEPESTSADVRVQELFHVSSTTDLNVSGVELLAEDDIFPKPLRTYSKSLSPRKNIKEDSLNISSSTEKDAISATTTPDASIRKRKTITDESETEDVDVTEVNKSVKRAKSSSYKNEENEPTSSNSEGDESLKIELSSHNKSVDSVKSGPSRLSYKNEETELTSSMKSEDSNVDNDVSAKMSIKSSSKKGKPKDKTSTPTTQSSPEFEIPMTPIHQEKTPRRGRPKKKVKEFSTVEEPNVCTATKSSSIIEDQSKEINASEVDSKLTQSEDVIEVCDVIEIVDSPKLVRATRRGRKAAEVIIPVKSTRRGKKAVEAEGDVNDKDVTVSDTPAKSVSRGRKAKEPEVDKDASVVSSIDEPVKNTRRGRPKKQDLEEIDAKTLESSQEAASPVKTTRRGKKATEDKTTTSLESAIEANPVKTTRRGKKVVEEQTAEDEAKPVEAKQVVTNRRGRKAVEVIELLDDDESESLETSADTNKQVRTTRRGKKTVDEQSVEDDETKTIDPKPVKATRRGRKAVEDVNAKPEKITRRGKKVDEVVELIEDDETDSLDTSKEVKTTRRGKKTVEEQSTEEAETKGNDVKSVKTTRRGKKAVEDVAEDDDTNSVDLKPPTRRGRKAAEAKPVEKVARGRRKQATENTDLEETEDFEKEDEKPKRALRGSRKAKTDDQEDEAEKPKRAVGKKAVHFKDNKNYEESDDEEEELLISTTKGKKRTAKEVIESQPAKKPARGKGRKKAEEVEEEEVEVESVKASSDDEEQVTSTKGRKRTAKVVADPQPAKKPKGRGRKKLEVDDEEEEVEPVKAKRGKKIEEVEEVPVATKKATRKRIFSSEDLNVLSEAAETKGKKTEETETVRKSARTRK